MRRFRSDENYVFGGVRYRIRQGRKGADDLVLEAYACETYAWVPVPMSLGQFLADFFSENELALDKERKFWRFNGDTYYLRSLHKAVRFGWRLVADETERARRRRAS